MPWFGDSEVKALFRLCYCVTQTLGGRIIHWWDICMLTHNHRCLQSHTSIQFHLQMQSFLSAISPDSLINIVWMSLSLPHACIKLPLCQPLVHPAWTWSFFCYLLRSLPPPTPVTHSEPGNPWILILDSPWIPGPYNNFFDILLCLFL